MENGCKRSGVKKIRIHDLRHSHASLPVERGFPPLLIAERLGQGRVQTAMEDIQPPESVTLRRWNRISYPQSRHRTRAWAAACLPPGALEYLTWEKTGKSWTLYGKVFIIKLSDLIMI